MKFPSLPGFNPEAFKKYLANASWLMLARVGSLMIKMLMTTFAIPAYLGSSLNGTLNYPLALITFFIGLSTLGTDGLVTRQLLHNPAERDRLLGTAFRMRVLASVFAIPLILLTYYIIANISAEQPAASAQQVGLVSLVCLLQSVQIIDSYFQSQVKGKLIMFVQVGANIISALLKFLLILLGASIDAFIAMLVVDVLLLSIGYMFLYKKQGLQFKNWTYDSKTAKMLLKIGWPLAISSIFVSLYMKIDQLMIDAILGKSALGVYSTVVNLSEGWYFIPVAVATALFPAIMNSKKQDAQLYQKRFAQLYELMVVISVGIAVVISILAPYIYTIYPADYHAGYSVLQVHIWSGVFAFLATASGQYLIAEGLTSISLFRTALGAITNISLNLIFIPKFGLMGAAYSTLCAYAVAGFSLLLLPRTRGHGLVLLKSIMLPHLSASIWRKIKK